MSTWAETGDDRLLAWENAVVLADLLNEALTDYQHDAARGQPPSLDDIGFAITSDADVVLGEHGQRLAMGALGFTYRQVLTMVEVLGHLLPGLAEAAHAARLEHQARRN